MRLGEKWKGQDVLVTYTKEEARTRRKAKPRKGSPIDRDEITIKSANLEK